MTDWKGTGIPVSGGGTTLAAVRDAISEMIGDYLHSTATGGDAAGANLKDTSLAKYPDTYFVDKVVYVTSGASIGDVRDIKTFTSSGGVIVPYAVFTATIVSGVTYEIHTFSPADKKTHINQALKDAYPYFYKRIEDATLTPQGSDDTEYDIPAAFTDDFPEQVWLRKTTDEKISLTKLNVDFKEVNGAKKFYADIDEDTEAVIWLVGKTFLTPFTTDTSSTELTIKEMVPICYKAIANLYYAQSVKVDRQDRDDFEKLAQQYDSKFMYEVSQHPMPVLKNTINMDWGWIT